MAEEENYPANFENDLREFRRLGAEDAEIAYYKTHAGTLNDRRRNELYDKLLRLLGDKKPLLIEFADRDMACFNPDTDYFYDCGFEDCLYFLQTLDRVAGRDFLIDRFFKNAAKG